MTVIVSVADFYENIFMDDVISRKELRNSPIVKEK